MRSLLCLLLASAVAASQEVQETPFVSAWPENPVVEFGNSLMLNCSTNCRDVLSGGLETSLEKEEAGDGGTWKAFHLVNISDWDPAPSCYFECGDAIDMRPHRVNITVYRVPELVELAPVPKMEVGKEYALMCLVYSVTPIRNLSVTFFKGGEKLHVKTFENYTAHEPDNVMVKHWVIAGPQDHGAEISCRAALDLRPDGPLFEMTSHNQSLTAVVFPSDPRLSSLRSMEVNTTKTVTCEVTGAFPAEDAQFIVTFAEERLTPRVIFSGNTATAQVQVSPSAAGFYSLECIVSLGPVTRLVQQEVNVYSLPDLVLTLRPPETLVNNKVDVVCQDSHPEETQPHTFAAQIRNRRGVLEAGNSLPLQAAVTAEEDDHGQEFTCQVEVEIDGRSIVRKVSAGLTVYYGPQMNESSCPGSQIWRAGREETLTCFAWGNPPPNVTCSKDDVLYPPGVPQLVTADHQGSYYCSAFNAHGSVTAFVTVSVKVVEPPTLIIGLVILAMVVLVSIAGVGYYMHYKAHKIKKYHLQQKKAQGNPSEKKCLNGDVQTDSV